jgi:hypothetical protein
MTAGRDLLLPDGLKLLLTLTLIIPLLFVIWVFTGFSPESLYIPFILAVIFSYAAACIIDYAIQNRTLKIAIASIAALVSIILGSILVRSMTMTMVCDPVHVPETTTVPTVITPVIPVETTPMIFDPVHEPNSCSQACRDAISNAAGSTEIAAQKLDECLRNCGR